MEASVKGKGGRNAVNERDAREGDEEIVKGVTKGGLQREK